jgi:acetyl-CoA carboxylase biotin carboxyl carrier protein
MTLTATVVRREDGRLALVSPAVGLWREAPENGSLVYSGARLGRLEVLGELSVIVAPEGAHGLVVEQGADASLARRPVGYGDTLLVLDPEVAAGVSAVEEQAHAHEEGALAFRAPSSGRFYASPAPGKPPFVSAGDVIETGHTVAILEVMKTFNRIQYGGNAMPERARVVRVVPADGDDLASGDPILELEPA